MALRYDERTGEFVETGGGSRRTSGRSSRSSRRSSGSSGGSGGSGGSAAESCGEKIGQGCGCLIVLWVVVKIAGCIF